MLGRSFTLVCWLVAVEAVSGFGMPSDGDPGAIEWLDLEFLYVGDVLSNPSGGSGTGSTSKYRGNVNIFLTLDCERAGLWRGGRFHLRGEQGHGQLITDTRLGGLQPVSNIEAHDFTQISEYWYEHELTGGKFRFKAGKQNVNDDFEAVEHGSVLLNDSFGATPVIPMPTFPDYGLGISAICYPMAFLKLGAGFYDGDGRGTTSGFDTAFDGEGGSFSIFELGIEPRFGFNGELRDNYRLGFWHHSGELEPEELCPLARRYASNYGLYLAVDKILFTENGRTGSGGESEKGFEGLGAFVQLAWPLGIKKQVSRYLGFGLSYRGLLTGRDQDDASFGLAHSTLCPFLIKMFGGGSETVLEATYKIHLYSGFALQPDIQYVINPGAADRSALVMGLRLEFVF